MDKILHPLFALLASVTRQELARQVAYLKEENRILRARLPERIVTTPQERARLLKVGRKLGTQLRELMSIASYESFRRWVREKEDGRTKRTNPDKNPTRKPGRPKTPDDIRALVIKIRKESNFGYTRILGELRKLGIHISRQTVKNILVEAGFTPNPEGTDKQDSWDAFLKRHADTLWQCDFLTKPMWTATGVVDLYLLVFLHLGTRRCWISPCTLHPDSAWVSQQAKNFLMEAEDMDLTPKMVMRDNDTKFISQFDMVFKASGAKIKRNTPLSPNLRAHVERFIQSLKHECLDKFMIVAQRHLNHICREWSAHYNSERPHEFCEHLPPACEHPPEPVESIKIRDMVCKTRLGGLLKHYRRRAA
ncbi:integrase core domain-containing protein [Thalassoglobus polymorphus]|uniref:Integrase core domain protein n=1 Tax=Thalassoglobus polymorphus TaxID=2527994 RepID=A0A517QQL0_9PLAN|nr:integrase core domain-containing protein [Thalassoglobus polymorphus]QDT33926.1 Integrase core domain protein [Thalassoglobus polymorphus]